MKMDYQRSFALSAAGMAVERTRVEVAAANLANAHTVQAPGQGAYQPVRVVAGSPAFSSLVEVGAGLPLPTATVESTLAPARMVHEPGHPLADARGFVAYPGLDLATEMMTLMSAARAYEANVAALNTARSLALKTLDIGRNA
jgi:flagellar basal-body rod protein FlgC